MKVILNAGISTTSEKLKAAAFLSTEETETDKLRDCNYGISWKVYFQELIDKYWENDPNTKVLFQVSIDFSNTKAHQTTVKIDYQKYPGCPMWLVERCMAIYQAIKSEMRKRKRMLDAKNKEKVEKLKSSGL